MNLNFRPSIDPVDTDLTYYLAKVTASGTVINRTSEILEPYDNYGFFKRTRPDKTPTVLSFELNPGARYDVMYTLALTATYLSQMLESGSDLENIWQTPLDSHIESIFKTVKVHEKLLQRNDFFLPQLAKEVIVRWIVKKANDTIEAETDRVKSLNNADPSTTRIDLDRIYAAINRLSFLDPNKTNVAKETIEKYLVDLNECLPRFVGNHQRFSKIAEGLETLNTSLEILKTAFVHISDHVILNAESDYNTQDALDHLFLEWKGALELCKKTNVDKSNTRIFCVGTTEEDRNLLDMIAPLE